jgi:uncharacterized protein (DUF433 family)
MLAVSYRSFNSMIAALIGVTHRDPEILSGTPVFVGTRVPVRSLFDYLEGGDTLEEFLRQFPSVAGSRRLRCWKPRVSRLRRMRILIEPAVPTEHQPADFGVVLVKSRSNRLADLARLVPYVLAAIGNAKAGRITVADA